MSSNRVLSPRALSERLRVGLSVVALLCLCFLLPASLFAQDASDSLMNTPVFTNQCTGPLGSLLPECQGGKSSINIAPQTQSGISVTTAPSVRGAVGTPGGEGRDSGKSGPVLAAEPPTEFQRYAASSIGQLLPIFGANLFSSVPSTFAPLDRVPVTANYVIGPGDELLLRVWGQVNLDLSLTVDRAGAVFVPQAGSINVSGMEFQQLPSYLKSQLGRVFRNFDLVVNMGELRSIQIFVVGHVRRPGSYTVSSLSTLVNALFASGGPSAQGSMRCIQLKRGAEVQTEFDLYDLLLKGDKSKDARLLPGDVVYIPPVGPQVAISGSAKNPAVYEISREKTIGELIQMAGGLSAIADVQRATLERIRERSSREAVDVRLDAAGLASPLLEGDILKVLTVTPQIANAVTLRGNVANPGRFPWHPGMRLLDVIPNRDSLVTRDYWKKRNLLGYTSPDDAVAAEPRFELSRKPNPTDVASAVPDINWSYAVVERQSAGDLSTELIPFHLGRLVLDKDDAQNMELRAGDVVTIFSQQDFRMAVAQQTRMIRLEGELASAGIYTAKNGETLGQLVERAGGLTPNAYLFGAEFTRESTRADQQRRLDQFMRELETDVEQTASSRIAGATTPEQTAAVNTKLQSERVMLERLRGVKATGRIVLNLQPGSKDISILKDFPLEDGDRFMVPARPSTVNVLGAVYNQNSFMYAPKLRVSDYLRQAGGATRNGDEGRMFIIRADGSVVPKTGFSLFSRSFDSTILNPGDSVVVPEAIFRGSLIQGLRDWTQVFAQLALGAAAINVLR